jgi:hypothetical protein
MSGQVADAAAPLDGWLGASGAVPAGTKLSLTAAAAALFYDLLANPASVSTSFGCHERTFNSGFYTGASHYNHPLSIRIWNKKPARAGLFFGGKVMLSDREYSTCFLLSRNFLQADP